MARQKSTPPESTDLAPAIKQNLVDDSARHGELLAQRDRALGDIESRFGIDRPYNREAFIGIAREAVVSAAERLLVLGRICILIKENEPHGHFGHALNEIGIGDVFARKAMQAAAKFEGSDARKLVAGRLSASKLLELVTEDDDTLDALADEGTVAGKTLDEIERMSARELRAALREEREKRQHDAEAHEDIVGRKDKKIAQLDLKARRLNKAPFREKLEAMLQEFNETAVLAQSALDSLRNGLLKLDELHNEAGESYTADVLEVIDGHARSVMALANDITELAKA